MKKYYLVISICLNFIFVAFLFFDLKGFFFKKRIVKSINKHQYWLGKDDVFKSIPSQKGGIVFLGDSHIQNFQANEYFPNKNIINRGIFGDSLASLTNRIEEIVRLKPSSLFIEIGINDLASGANLNEVFEKYKKLLIVLKQAFPQCKIFVMSVLPTSIELIEYPQYSNPEVNQKVLDLNAKLRKLPEITFIDIYNVLHDGKGLKRSFTVDGIHLSGAGYLTFFNVLKPYVN